MLDLDDVAVQANAWAYLADALHWPGRFAESIQVAEEGLARFPRHLPSTEWAYGVNPYTVLSFWRALGLIWAGRLQEGFEELGRCRRYSEEEGTPEMIGYITSWSAQTYYYANDPDRALDCARQTEEIDRKSTRLNSSHIQKSRMPSSA